VLLARDIGRRPGVPPARAARARSGSDDAPLADQFWGARYGVLRDPFGHRWSLATQRVRPSRGELDQAAKSFGSHGE